MGTIYVADYRPPELLARLKDSSAPSSADVSDPATSRTTVVVLYQTPILRVNLAYPRIVAVTVSPKHLEQPCPRLHTEHPFAIVRLANSRGNAGLRFHSPVTTPLA
jgi:hypothetical protein